MSDRTIPARDYVAPAEWNRAALSAQEEDQTPAPRIDDEIQTEVLAAAVASTDKATVTLQIAGSFGRPGSRVEIPPIVVMLTVPATVTPA